MTRLCDQLWREQDNSLFTLGRRQMLLLLSAVFLAHQQPWVLEHQRQARTWPITQQGFRHEHGEAWVQKCQAQLLQHLPAALGVWRSAQGHGCCPLAWLLAVPSHSWPWSLGMEALGGTVSSAGEPRLEGRQRQRVPAVHLCSHPYVPWPHSSVVEGFSMEGRIAVVLSPSWPSS